MPNGEKGKRPREFEAPLEFEAKGELREALLNKCERTFEKGDYDETIKCCLELEKKVPDLTISYFYKAASYLEQGKLNDALAATDEGLKKDPRFSLLHSTRGLILIRQGRLKDALNGLNDSLQYKAEPSTLVLAFICAALVQNKTLAEGYIKKAADIDFKTTAEAYGSFVNLIQNGELPEDVRKKLVNVQTQLREELLKLKRAEENLEKVKRKKK